MKLKVNLKEINFKQLLLQKGEYVGLGMALTVMLFLLVFDLGINGLAGGSAAATSEKLQRLSSEGQRKLITSQPPKDIHKIDPELTRAGNLVPLDPEKYACVQDFFIPGGENDLMWRKPEMLAPDEFQADLIRALVRSYIFNKSNKGLQVMYLTPKGKAAGPNPAMGMQPRGGRFAPLQGMGGFRPGQMQGFPGGDPMANPLGDGNAKQEHATKWVSVDELAKDEKVPSSWPAETMLPHRIIVVHAGLPFRKQIELFRRALRYDSIRDMEKDATIDFRGLNIQRRVYLPNGAVQNATTNDGWQDLDVKNSLRALLVFGTEKEDKDLMNYGVIWPKDRLVIPRPLLARGQKYPEPSLKGIKDTIEALEKTEKGGKAPPFRQPKSKFGDNFDIFENTEETPSGPMQPMLTTVPADAGQDVLLPEKCLVRFLDVTVEPGFAYEYRIQIQMANPLYQKRDKAVSADLTKDEHIEGPWSAATPKVSVPHELSYYVMDEPAQKSRSLAANPDRAWVQIHRWLDSIQVVPGQKITETAVGDWSVAEFLPVHRGEYIGKWEDTEVPVWWPTLESFVFAVPPKKNTPPAFRAGQHKGVPVDYHTGAVLVDFQGGKQELNLKRENKPVRVLDESATQMLTLSPEGKLLVRTSRPDTDNADRKERLQAWKDRQEEVKTGLANKNKNAKPGNPLFDKK